jgi:hypothetical protein
MWWLLGVRSYRRRPWEGPQTAQPRLVRMGRAPDDSHASRSAREHVVLTTGPSEGDPETRSHKATHRESDGSRSTHRTVLTEAAAGSMSRCFGRSQGRSASLSVPPGILASPARLRPRRAPIRMAILETVEVLKGRLLRLTT